MGYLGLFLFLALSSSQAFGLYTASTSPNCRALFRKIPRTEVTSPKDEKVIVIGPETKQSDRVVDRNLDRENEAADILAEFGFVVVRNPYKAEYMSEYFKDTQAKEGLNPNRRPDYMIGEGIWDHFAPRTEQLGKAIKGIRSKVKEGQTHRVVMNVIDNKGYRKKEWDVEDVINILRDPKRVHKDLWEVILIHGTRENPLVTTVFPQIVRHSKVED